MMDEKFKELARELELKYRGLKWFSCVAIAKDSLIIFTNKKVKLNLTEYKDVPVQVIHTGRLEIRPCE